MRVLSVLLAILTGAASSAGADRTTDPARVWAPSEAAETLARTGRLDGVVVTGDLDLTRLVPGAGVTILTITDAVIDGYVLGPAPVALELRGGRARGIGLSGAATRWAEPIRIDDAALERISLSGAELGPFSCIACRVDAVRLKGTRFASEARLGLVVASDLDMSGAVFAGAADLRGIDVTGPAVLRNARFEGDASLIDSVLAGGIDLSGARFEREFDLRNCRIARLHAGRGRGGNLASAFEAGVDGRNCHIDRFDLDFVTFARGADFRLSRIDDIRLGEISGPARGLDLRGVSGAGPVRLAATSVPSLDFQWSGIEHRLVIEDASVEMRRALTDAVRQTGDPLDARRASYAVKAAAWADIADLGAERSFAVALDWVLWTWPTKDGTSLTRLFVLAMALWVFAAIAMTPARGRLARLPARPERFGAGLRPWHEIARPDLPAGTRLPLERLDRVLSTLVYAFSLTFLFSSGSLRHATPSGAFVQSPYTPLRLAIWVAGKYIVLLAALTLASLTPALQGLLPGG